MRALKALVIGMAVLIVIGMGLVVYGMVRQADNLSRRQTFGDVNLSIPAGCQLVEAITGDRGLLVLRLTGEGGQGCEQVLVFDSLRGEFRGRIHLSAQ